MTHEEWVHAVNELCAKIDEIALSLHPSAWPEQLAALHEEYFALCSKGEE